MALKCVFCGLAHLPSESCGRDTEAGLARAVLSEASARAGVEYRPPRDLPMPKAEFQAPVRSSGSVAATLGPPVAKKAGFDRAAYHKAYMKTYMREYMRGWRARKKAGA
jgi:hypothetical protein